MKCKQAADIPQTTYSYRYLNEVILCAQMYKIVFSIKENHTFLVWVVNPINIKVSEII